MSCIDEIGIKNVQSNQRLRQEFSQKNSIQNSIPLTNEEDIEARNGYNKIVDEAKKKFKRAHKLF